MSTNQTVTVSYTPVRQFGSDDGILANGDLITVSFRTLRASLRLFGGGFSGRPPAHINITDPVNPPVDSIQTTPTFDYLMVGTPVGGATSIDLSVLRTPAGSAATTSVDLTNAQLFSIDDTGSYSLVPSELWTRIDKWTIQVNQTDGGKIDLDGMQNGQIRNRLILLSAAAHASTAIQATSSTTVAATPTSSSSNGGGGGGGCLLGTNFRAAIVIPLLLMIGLVGLMRRRRLSY
ncbi:MAG: hypothetical protein D6698_16900 [Gammaproteobacteria bacterium]|nr:MAG: hypothetical protein D6698_16900 [Gammaproteobacteria bacterium]